MAGKGGWFKSYDDELDDPKITRLTDFEYRIWRVALAYCNRSPGRLRRPGYLYHSEGFPVDVSDFGRVLRKADNRVLSALEKLCQVGGESSLLVLEDVNGAKVYRVRAWRKRQWGQDGDEPVTEPCQDGDSLCGPYVDVDVDVDKRRRRKTNGLAPDVAGAPPSSSKNKRVQWYLDSRTEAGKPSIVVSNWERTGSTVKRVEEALGTEECRRRFALYLASADPWYAKQNWNLDWFFSRAVNQVGSGEADAPASPLFPRHPEVEML